MKPIIEITGLGKKYPIVHDKTPYRTLRETIINRIKHPFSKTKTHETFWALKDINLTINRGEIIGIIGKNGAGKSTLLKILSGITKPSEGKIKIYGRVSSLLEVGTGFHPELTGRENIYLNGVILGMTRKEVSKKFDEIVTFAGVEKFLDTPVKHYSSGMYVRLAFSIAAHLEPDILIVDEVLAVGDAEFQKKCLGKMEEVSKTEGRTVIFVSHNLDVIEKICKRVACIEKGKIIDIGEPIDVVKNYVGNTNGYTNIIQNNAQKKEAHIESIRITNGDNDKASSIFEISSPIKVKIKFTVITKLSNVILCLIFFHDNKTIYSISEGDIDGKLRNYEPGEYESTIVIPSFFFNVGTYRININIQRPSIEFIDFIEIFIKITSSINNMRDKIFGGKIYGQMAALIRINTDKNE